METDRDNISVRVASFAYYLDTAKDNFVRAVSAQETPLVFNPEKTMSHTTKPTLTTNVSHSKHHNKDTVTSLRVNSFSYNRDRIGENFVFSVPDPIEDPTTAFTFSQGNPKKDGEIGVFGADKYFSMKLEYQTSQKHERPVDLIGIESKIKPRTPSLCSEASSSWNSQSALLSTMHRNGSQQTKPKKPVRRRIFAGLGCQGPCFDKKDVHVNDLVFTPPINPNHATENDLTVRKKLNVSDIEESRTSIEVFGSTDTIKSKGSSDVAANMERKLSMLTWDAIPVKKGQNFQTSTTVNSTICDDMASDASSDLFEIENISGTLYPMLSSATETDNVSTCMSPAYAPSEDSIQWSVVTASAADYSSVLSEFNDETSRDLMNGGNNNRKFKPRNDGEKEVHQKNKVSGGLLGCKNQKAVDVAESVCTDKARVKDKDTLQLPRSYMKIH